MSPQDLITDLVRTLPELNLVGRVDKDFPVVELEVQVLPVLVENLKKRPEWDFSMLSDLTAVDWWKKRKPRFDLVYHFLSLTHYHRLRVKVAVEEGEEVPTLTAYYHAANWLEREVWDLYGIKFQGHPDLKRLLLYEEFEGHPLRKDYPYNKRQPLIPETWPVRSVQIQMKEGKDIHRP